MKKKIQPNLEFLNFRIVQIIQMKNLNCANNSETKFKILVCKSAIIKVFSKYTFILNPDKNSIFKTAFDETMRLFTAALSEQMQKANELDKAIQLNLAKIGNKL